MTTAAAQGNAGGYRAVMRKLVAVVRYSALALGAALGGLAASVASADAELADLATRVAFGYYSGDAAVVRAAERQLERHPAQDARVRYLRALAALRRAQLELATRADADVRELLAHCTDLAAPAVENPRRAAIRVASVRDAAAAEAWTLAAACAAFAAHVEPLRSGAHGRRRDEALARARAADPGNPRVELVEAWGLSLQPAAADDDVRAAAAQAYAEAIAAFAAFSAPSREPVGAVGHDWGEAEALASLAEIRLRDGARREARDLVERALLAAPGYVFAERLASEVRGER